VTVRAPVEQVAASMRETLGFDLDARRDCPTWTDALRLFIADADAAGILVMCNGVVMNNNRRKLDPEEFRGFAIADRLGPLVFINGADTKSAQMFTLAHELAHLWLGQSAISDATARVTPDQETESWCNQVAAELLVPMDVLRAEVRKTGPLPDEVNRLARRFKVSTLVILRRIHDAGSLSKAAFARAYDDELTRLLAIDRGSGGNFYLTQAARAGKRFSRALIASTFEGQTLFRDAFRMLGISKLETFQELGKSRRCWHPGALAGPTEEGRADGGAGGHDETILLSGMAVGVELSCVSAPPVTLRPPMLTHRGARGWRCSQGHVTATGSPGR
jgi:Zn-dependent peptidase ImmA (M78 family)